MGWDYANDGKNLQSYHVLDSFRVVEKTSSFGVIEYDKNSIESLLILGLKKSCTLSLIE